MKGNARATGVREDSLERVAEDVVACERCPRLREHCLAVARAKRRAFAGETYWGRPVPGFGDPQAELLVVGLAPAAHGANRTGRMFTGDSSGDWLYRALYRFGFASQPHSIRPGDGLELKGAYITAVGRCAPPENRLTPAERLACRSFLEREILLLSEVRVVLCLGQVAFETCAAVFAAWNWVSRAEVPKFAHGASCAMDQGRRVLLASYHPSRQNTQTGRLTEPMLDAVVGEARRLVESLGG